MGPWPCVETAGLSVANVIRSLGKVRTASWPAVALSRWTTFEEGQPAGWEGGRPLIVARSENLDSRMRT